METSFRKRGTKKPMVKQENWGEAQVFVDVSPETSWAKKNGGFWLFSLEVMLDAGGSGDQRP